MERQPNQNKKISVRLDSDSVKKLNEAIEKGYTTSQYVNAAIKGSTAADISFLRKLIIHVNNLQSQIEFEEDLEVKNYMREEIHQIWRVLKSLQDHT